MAASARTEGPPDGTAAVDATRPLGVYVHFPFCTSRCPYCDFAVSVRRDIPHDAYADAITTELAARRASFTGARGPGLVSIYFGGGTPALWQVPALDRVLRNIRASFPAAGPLEITVEANPGELAPARLSELRAAGVNRLSFGAQSFDDVLLAGIGRTHTARATASSLAAARAAGFDNLCADLMFGLPGQTLADWQASLAALVALEPQHITAYALTVEPGTRFGLLERTGRLVRPADEETAGMYRLCHDLLTSTGYEHYEISSYARPGFRSRHNTLYWTMGAYLGLGVSAASFLPLADGTGWRGTNPRTVKAYRDAIRETGGALPPDELRSSAELEAEALWLGLRTVEGIDRAAHARRYGHDPLADAGRGAVAQRCAELGWLSVTPDRLRLLPAGFLFADEVVVQLWAADPGRGSTDRRARAAGGGVSGERDAPPPRSSLGGDEFLRLDHRRE